MSRYHPRKDLQSIFAAADKVKRDCFLGDGSLFSGESLWTAERVDEVRAAFWANADADGGYLAKMDVQMAAASPAARKLMAELNYFLLLFPTGIRSKTKRAQIQKIWSWSGEELSDQHPLLADDVLSGIGNPGAAFSTMRWRELIFLFDIVTSFKALPIAEREATLSEGWEFSAWLKDVPREGNRQFRHIIRYLFFPDAFERIVVGKDKRRFINLFLGDELATLNGLDDISLDRKLLEARRKMEADFPETPFDFYIAAKQLEAASDAEAEEVPSNITRAHLLQAMERIDGVGIPSNAQSSTYDVDHDGKLYPPKLVVSWANAFANGEELNRLTFSGGRNTPCFRLLEREGFTIRQKGSPLRASLHRILSEYRNAIREPLADHPLAKLIRKEYPALIAETLFQEDDNVAVTGTKFVGKWAHVPWIAILDKRITDSTQRGLYAVLLFSESGEQVFFTIAQGVTEEADAANAERTKVVLSALSIPSGYSEGPLEALRLGTSTKARRYANSVVTYKAFSINDLPSDDEIERELTALRAYLDDAVANPRLLALYQAEGDAVFDGEEEVGFDPYSLDDAVKSLFIAESSVRHMLHLLRTKKNLIVQGPPGVGKTFVAKRLAFALMEEKDTDRLAMVQFHQSYSYEDFIQGYRPSEQTFKLKNGHFFRFCQTAQQDPDNDYVFIIDEINRGNLSRIFGELMMLIESDKRGAEWGIQLAYSDPGDPLFYVPANLHIVGLMNTADRSLAIVDYALRRRFAFVDLDPGFQSPAFRTQLQERGASTALVNKIVNRMSALNAEIENDRINLGAGFRIGHSYFCPNHEDVAYTDSWYRSVIETEIAPLLREYWFDMPDKAEEHYKALLDG